MDASQMDAVREPAVAGTFYPNDPTALRSMIDDYLPADNGDELVSQAPKAIIAPHAGYIYSGSIAGRAYAQLRPVSGIITRVVLMGPSHRVAFRGMAVPSSTSFRTPLGDIPIASDAIQKIIESPDVGFLDQAHAQEHSLEVHLPFLQSVLGEFDLVPIVVGDANKESVANILTQLWGGDETLIVISSDLSHYEAYSDAQELDKKTKDKIETLDATLVGSDACGCRPVNGLLHYLKHNSLGIETIDIKNSGDTAGDKKRVVGYGAWRVMQKQKSDETPLDEWSLAERQTLLQLAREAIRSPLEGEKNFNLNLDRFSPRLRQQRATFVTLNIEDRLRGCIGSLQAHRPLALDTAHNAQAAAFKDPRFSALTHAEYQKIDIHISILSEPKALIVSSRDELINQLRPGIDGLIIKEDGRQATYLPSVWEQLPTADQFVLELRKKAGLPGEGWQANTETFIYSTEEFS